MVYILTQEMMGDHYRMALASFYLGQACVRTGEAERALTVLEKAQSLFQQLGEHPMLARTEAALKLVPVTAVAKTLRRTLSATIVSALTLGQHHEQPRLLEALKAYQWAFDQDPLHPKTYEALIRVAQSLGDQATIKRANRTYQRAAADLE